MKIIVKKRIEDFVVKKIEEILGERQRDMKMVGKLQNIQNKINNRINKL